MKYLFMILGVVFITAISYNINNYPATCGFACALIMLFNWVIEYYKREKI